MNKKILIWILAFVFCFTFILGSFKLNVFMISGNQVTSDLVYFLEGNGGIEHVSSFNEVEREHLYEVRDVMQMFLFLLKIFVVIALALIIALYYNGKAYFSNNLANSLHYAGIITIVVVVLLFLMSLNFDWLFANFHSLLFETQWQFPADSLLIQMFPLGFFVNIFKRILIFAFVFGLISIGVGYKLKKP